MGPFMQAAEGMLHPMHCAEKNDITANRSSRSPSAQIGGGFTSVKDKGTD